MTDCIGIGVSVERGGKPIIHGVDIEIAPGKITALLGANGAGKSSLVLSWPARCRSPAATCSDGKIHYGPASGECPSPRRRCRARGPSRSHRTHGRR